MSLTVRLTFLALLSIRCVQLACCVLRVNLSARSSESSPTKILLICVDCPHPEQEGTLLIGLQPKHGLKDYSVSGELVYCVPNHADVASNDGDFLNDRDMVGRVVLVDRGQVALHEKVLSIQKTNAIGVIIADDGGCDDQFAFCGARVGGVREGGFASHDDPLLWRDVNIPVLLVSTRSAEKIRSLMGNRRVDIPRLGWHNITEIDDRSRDEL